MNNKLNGLTLNQCDILQKSIVLFSSQNGGNISSKDNDDCNYLLLQLEQIEKSLEEREEKRKDTKPLCCCGQKLDHENFTNECVPF